MKTWSLISLFQEMGLLYGRFEDGRLTICTDDKVYRKAKLMQWISFGIVVYCVALFFVDRSSPYQAYMADFTLLFDEVRSIFLWMWICFHCMLTYTYFYCHRLNYRPNLQYWLQIAEHLQLHSDRLLCCRHRKVRREMVLVTFMNRSCRVLYYIISYFCAPFATYLAYKFLYAGTEHSTIYLVLFIPKCIQMVYFTYLFCCIICFLPLLFTFIANYVRFEFYKVQRKMRLYVHRQQPDAAQLADILTEYDLAKSKLIRTNMFWKNLLGAYFLYAIAITCLMQYFYINTRVLILQVMFAVVTPFQFLTAVVWPNIKSTQVSSAILKINHSVYRLMLRRESSGLKLKSQEMLSFSNSNFAGFTIFNWYPINKLHLFNAFMAVVLNTMLIYNLVAFEQ